MVIFDKNDSITLVKFLPSSEVSFYNNLIKQLKTVKGWNQSQIEFYQTKIPHLMGHLWPSLTEISHYKSSITEVLERGIADFIEVEESPNESISIAKELIIQGKKIWIYCDKKIRQFDSLMWLYKQENRQEGPSIIYEFVTQAEKSFSTDPYIELILPGLLTKDLFELLETEELDNCEAEEQKILGNFLTKCDQILLETWGEKKFRDNLAVLGVSLEEWLKAVNIVIDR
jgi:hypothetical protein